MPRAFLILAALCACVASATLGAQGPLRLEFKEGRVWLDAKDMTVAAILREWSSLGGVTVVNGERVVEGPVSLRLDGVGEREAIEILLRHVPGYILIPRREGSSGPSAFDRILVLPTTTPLTQSAQRESPVTSAPDIPADLPEALADLMRSSPEPAVAVER